MRSAALAQRMSSVLREVPSLSGLAHEADAENYTPAHSNITICGLELTSIWLPRMYGYSFKLDFVNLW